MLNQVILIGRLTKDPELSTTSSQTTYCTMRIAVSRPSSSEERTDFLNVICWGKLAENVAKFMAKGRLVAVEGRIETSQYTAQDGSIQYYTRINARNVVFLDRPKEQQMQPQPQMQPQHP